MKKEYLNRDRIITIGMKVITLFLEGKEMNAYLLGALFSLIAIVVFVLENDTQVAVRFISWTSTPISLALVVLISAAAGALITFLLDSYRAFKTGQRLRSSLNQNRKYEKEIKALKGGRSTPKDKEEVE